MDLTELEGILRVLSAFNVSEYEDKTFKVKFADPVPPLEIVEEPSVQVAAEPESVRSDGLTAREQIELYGTELP